MRNPDIIIGISDTEEIEPLIKEGAGEFYAGLYHPGKIPLANHRPANADYNFTSFQELKEAIGTCHGYGKRLFLIVNELSYPPGLYKVVIVLMLRAFEMGIDGFIVADFYLLQELQKTFRAAKITTKIHLSSLTNCFNAMEMQYYKQFNISRVILPQQMYAREAKAITGHLGIETEVFYHKANDCINVDGRCHFCSYRLYDQRPISGYPCSFKFNILNGGGPADPDLFSFRRGITSGINSHSNLYDFVKMGVTAIKVGIREKSRFAFKLRLLKELMREISLISQTGDKTAFLREVHDAT